MNKHVFLNTTNETIKISFKKNGMPYNAIKKVKIEPCEFVMFDSDIDIIAVTTNYKKGPNKTFDFIRTRIPTGIIIAD